jgi:hypothetical protein
MYQIGGRVMVKFRSAGFVAVLKGANRFGVALRMM